MLLELIVNSTAKALIAASIAIAISSAYIFMYSDTSQATISNFERLAKIESKRTLENHYVITDMKENLGLAVKNESGTYTIIQYDKINYKKIGHWYTSTPTITVENSSSTWGILAEYNSGKFIAGKQIYIIQ